MTRKVLSGLPQLEAALKHLSDKAADRVSKAALGGGGAVLRREIKKLAPVGPTGNLKEGIKYRFIKAKGRQQVSAKAGINVGKQKRDKVTKQFSGVSSAPHGHLVGAGTKKTRYRTRLGGRFSYIQNPTDEQLSTGRMPANSFVKRGTRAARPMMIAAMQKRSAKALIREAAKAKRKK